MAPVAFILGGISGTLSALFGMLLFGLSLWGAVQTYFTVGLSVAVLMIAIALLRKNTPANSAITAKPRGLQQA